MKPKNSPTTTSKSPGGAANLPQATFIKPPNPPLPTPETPIGGPPTRQVLIIDDHPMLRMGITLLVNNCPGWKICAEAGSGNEAMEKIRHFTPDLILLDLTLPDRNGLDLLQELQEALPEVPVLILSMHNEMLYAERALRGGARGYVMKEAGGAKLIEALNTVVAGGVVVSERVSSELLGNLNRRSQAAPRSPMGSLTDREFEIFQLIGEGKSTRIIATQLGLSPKTVDVHRANIKEKLHVRDLPTLIRQAVCWVESQRLTPNLTAAR